MFIGVVNDRAEEDHQDTYKSSNIHAQVLVKSNLTIADGYGHIAYCILIVQLVVVVDFLTNLVGGHEQADDLVALGGAVDLCHDPGAGGPRKVAEHRVAWEKQYLVSLLCAVLGFVLC